MLVRSLEYRRPLVIRHEGATLTIHRLAGNVDGERQFEIRSSPPGAFRVGICPIKGSMVVPVKPPCQLRIGHGKKSINMHFYTKRGCSKPRVSIDADHTWYVVPREITPPLAGRFPIRRPLAG